MRFTCPHHQITSVLGLQEFFHHVFLKRLSLVMTKKERDYLMTRTFNWDGFN